MSLPNQSEDAAHDQSPIQSTKILSVIERIQAGDSSARNELLELTFERFRIAARKMLNHPSRIDLRDKGIESVELVSETLLQRIFRENRDGKTLLDRQKFDSGKAFIAAVIDHMHYCLLDFAKGRGDMAVRQHQFRPRDLVQAADDDLNQHPDPNQATDISAPHWIDLLHAMERLDPSDRVIFECRYLEGLSREETAAALEISTKTVTRRCRIAMQQLGEQMKLMD